MAISSSQAVLHGLACALSWNVGFCLLSKAMAASQHGITRLSLMQHGTARHSMAQHGTAGHSMAQRGIAWHIMTQHGSCCIGSLGPSAMHTLSEQDAVGNTVTCIPASAPDLHSPSADSATVPYSKPAMFAALQRWTTASFWVMSHTGPAA